MGCVSAGAGMLMCRLCLGQAVSLLQGWAALVSTFLLLVISVFTPWSAPLAPHPPCFSPASPLPNTHTTLLLPNNKTPPTGKVVDEAHMTRDILLMKQCNINAVRASHYPNIYRW